MSALFTLRLSISGGRRVTIRAFEGRRTEPNHTRIECELWLGSPRKNRQPLFPRKDFHVGLVNGNSLDGIEAKELVLSLFCLKPGDTDDEFFKDYTPEQLAFFKDNGDELGLIRETRYCDENGNVRRAS
jgi:hypothetical protein